MILQTLDIKNNCKGIFHEGRFLFENIEDLLPGYSRAWKHSPMLDDEKFQYLHLYLRGEDLSSYCGAPQKYNEYVRTLQSHATAAKNAKINISEVCFFDLVPEKLMKKWFSLKQEALEVIGRQTPKPSDYDILHKAHVLATNISQQDVFFENKKGRVLYNIFGSATGRLTTEKNSVPVLTLKREQRELLKPQNDAFVELDLNAAEVRTLMALSGQDQPQGDIHEWVVRNVFDCTISRSKAKVELFAWLYNPSSSKSRFDQIFSRAIFRDFYLFEDQLLTTPFGRKLAVDERKAQNYLLQSTTSDIVVQNSYYIMKMLKDTESKVAFTLHDSVILDIRKSEIPMLRQIKNQFEKTPWGKFASTCKVGKDFGSLKEIKL